MALQTVIAVYRGSVGNLGGRFLYRRHREKIKEDSGNGTSLFMGSLGGEPGHPEGYVKIGSGNGRLLHRGPNGGPGRGRCFTEDF